MFESSQHPIIVGQAAYNSAYGTSFSAGSNCNPVPNATNPGFQICDGFVRVADNVNFGFNTLKNQTTKTIMHLEPKALHDETNASTFDPYGRMQANLGVEAQPATSVGQNVTLYPYINPITELINGTNLPKESVTYDANGDPVSDISITPISSANDGTQIWRITHNGVDTHPIHFHLYDVQLINRVTWDNIIIPPDANELGWKDTVRVSPLEDTIVALRPVVPQVPFEVPNSIRNLSPMDADRLHHGLQQHRPGRQPGRTPITNQLVNFGWEYVWHCHILSHEEMDMMRPQSLVLPPIAPSGLTNTLSGTGTTAPGRADVAGQLHHRDVVQRAAVHQPGQHVDDDHHHPVAAERGQHPPVADLHRSVDVQPDHHGAVLPGARQQHRRVRGRRPVPTDDGHVHVQHPRGRPELHHHGQRRRRRHDLADRRGDGGQGRQPDVHDHAERQLPPSPPSSSTA